MVTRLNTVVQESGYQLSDEDLEPIKCIYCLKTKSTLIRQYWMRLFERALVAWWIGELTLNPLGFSSLWFEPCSNHEWSGVFPGYSGFRPPLMNDRLDKSEIFLKSN